MRKLRYHLVDVFTGERFGGNPLAVFTNGRGVSTELMQQIAKELNLSETTFVLPPDDLADDWRVRIFTPANEMPTAGHPTIGTAFVLAREHLVNITPETPTIRLEENVGVIPVTFDFDDHGHLLITMQQPLPRFGPVFDDRRDIAELLSLDVGDLEDAPLEVVSCGVPFLMVPLRTLNAVARVRYRLDVWERLLRDFAAPQALVFARQAVRPEAHLHARMFAPHMGILEDPATGSAAGPLGCYLVRCGWAPGSPASFVCEQGFEIGRPSFLHITIEHSGGQISRVSVGGQCVYIGEGAIEI